nr:DUF106 domain-containing protein [Candidatus Woesearchaeota archaeon]
MALNNFFNFIFGWAVNISPLIGMIVISFFLTLIVTLVYKWTTDQVMMKSLKDELKQHQKEMKNYKDDPKKMMEIQGKAMEKNMKYFMHSLKPMIITFIPLILVFGWLKLTYNGIEVLFGLSWIWSYIIFSMIFSIVLRKVLKVY